MGKLLLLLAGLVAAEAFIASSPSSFLLRHGGVVSHKSTMVPSRAELSIRNILRTRMSTAETKIDDCEGPAKSGPVGNVDVSNAKKTSNDIKTDGIIVLSENAKKQIAAIKASRVGNVVLRVGVRAGGCSGMSYVMEFEDESKIDAKDTELPFDGFKIVVDPKSLMFIYGMTLDYSDALIGGGFKFSNPNAESTCGCGQSFGA